MLSFDIRDLQAHAAKVDGSLPADDPVWQEGDPLPAGPVHATGRLSAAGSRRFYWHGRIAAAAEISCRRCLAPVTARISDDVHAFFAEAGDEEAEDPDVFTLPAGAHVVDLRPAIREQWLLSVPPFAVCRDDCKGLCPTCGADLNAGACDCRPAADSRWDTLRVHRGGSDQRPDSY
jgi:uncharacterized protein